MYCSPILLLLSTVVLASSPSVVEILQTFSVNKELDVPQREVLRHAPEEDLPRAVRSFLVPTKVGDHVCCRDKQIHFVRRSRTVRLLGTDGKYHQRTEYFTTTVEGGCPTSQLTCCVDYIYVSDKCVRIDQLHELAQHLVG